METSSLVDFFFCFQRNKQIYFYVVHISMESQGGGALPYLKEIGNFCMIDHLFINIF